MYVESLGVALGLVTLMGSMSGEDGAGGSWHCLVVSALHPFVVSRGAGSSVMFVLRAGSSGMLVPKASRSRRLWLWFHWICGTPCWSCIAGGVICGLGTHGSFLSVVSAHVVLSSRKRNLHELHSYSSLVFSHLLISSGLLSSQE